MIHYRPAGKNLTGCDESNHLLPRGSTTTNVENVRCLPCLEAVVEMIEKALDATRKNN